MTYSTPHVDIREHTAAICRAVGVEPKLVTRLDITPIGLDAYVHVLGDDGQPRITESGDAVEVEVVSFEVSA